MPDPFATALAALFRSPLGAVAIYTPPGGQPTGRIFVIRSQGTQDLGNDRLADTNEVSIMRSDVAQPLASAELAILALDPAGNEISRETFTIQGGAHLDDEGLSWKCSLEPAAAVAPPPDSAMQTEDGSFPTLDDGQNILME